MMSHWITYMLQNIYFILFIDVPTYTHICGLCFQTYVRAYWELSNEKPNNTLSWHPIRSTYSIVTPEENTNCIVFPYHGTFKPFCLCICEYNESHFLRSSSNKLSLNAYDTKFCQIHCLMQKNKLVDKSLVDSSSITFNITFLPIYSKIKYYNMKCTANKWFHFYSN